MVINKILVELLTDISFISQCMLVVLFLIILDGVMQPVGICFMKVPINFQVVLRIYLHKSESLLKQESSFAGCFYLSEFYIQIFQLGQLRGGVCYKLFVQPALIWVLHLSYMAFLAAFAYFWMLFFLAHVFKLQLFQLQLQFVRSLISLFPFIVAFQLITVISI